MTSYANMTEAAILSDNEFDVELDFAQWKTKVDNLCVMHFGLSSDDLPDAPWADYHHDNMTPTNAVDTAVIDAWYDIPEIEELWHG
mgnify:FL=1